MENKNLELKKITKFIEGRRRLVGDRFCQETYGQLYTAFLEEFPHHKDWLYTVVIVSDGYDPLRNRRKSIMDLDIPNELKRELFSMALDRLREIKSYPKKYIRNANERHFYESAVLGYFYEDNYWGYLSHKKWERTPKLSYANLFMTGDTLEYALITIKREIREEEGRKKRLLKNPETRIKVLEDILQKGIEQGICYNLFNPLMHTLKRESVSEKNLDDIIKQFSHGIDQYCNLVVNEKMIEIGRNEDLKRLNLSVPVILNQHAHSHSHGHVHMLSDILEVVQRIAADYGKELPQEISQTINRYYYALWLGRPNDYNPATHPLSPITIKLTPEKFALDTYFRNLERLVLLAKNAGLQDVYVVHDSFVLRDLKSVLDLASPLNWDGVGCIDHYARKVAAEIKERRGDISDFMGD